MKNAFYMLCEDRNCEWTDVLESVISSMNATINSATGISPHYIITGRYPNIGLPKLQGRDIINDNPGAYGMQINALLRQVHHRVALANDEADHKLEASLNHLTYKDPIQVGAKVLLHRPKSTVAKSSHLPWVGDFEVTKTNHMMCQVKNENGDTAWIHQAHIRHLAPRPTHLYNKTPPPSLCNTQNTQDPSPPPSLEAKNSTKTYRPDNVTPQRPQNETEPTPIRSTRGQIPTRFRDFIMY